MFELAVLMCFFGRSIDITTAPLHIKTIPSQILSAAQSVLPTRAPNHLPPPTPRDNSSEFYIEQWSKRFYVVKSDQLKALQNGTNLVNRCTTNSGCTNEEIKIAVLTIFHKKNMVRSEINKILKYKLLDSKIKYPNEDQFNNNIDRVFSSYSRDYEIESDKSDGVLGDLITIFKI